MITRAFHISHFSLERLSCSRVTSIVSKMAHTVLKFKLVPVVVETSHLKKACIILRTKCHSCESSIVLIFHLLIASSSFSTMVDSNLIAVGCSRRRACKAFDYHTKYDKKKQTSTIFNK